MDVERAAALIAASVSAPPGAVSAAAWYENATPEIMVWYDPRYVRAVTALPNQFEGYRVTVKPRPRFVSA